MIETIHLFGERKLCRALRLRMARRLILDTGQTTDWAGANPAALPPEPWRSLQPQGQARLCCPVVCPCPAIPQKRRKHVDH